jgi:hypothetical protein
MTDVTRREVIRALGMSAGVAAATVAVPTLLDLDDAFAETPAPRRPR